MYKKSEKLLEQALNSIPLGSQTFSKSLTQYPRGVSPFFIDKGNGSKVWDVDGNEYIDFVGSWGTAILGHSHEEVINAVCDCAQSGLSFGATQEKELHLAEIISNAIPSVDLVRFVNSGTEACMTAIRLARAYSQKKKILKFTGNYHGHSDSLLVEAGSGLATLSIPSSPGIPEEFTELTLCIPFNNRKKLEQTILTHKDDLAAVIFEPIVGNSGFIRAQNDFLKTLMDLCYTHNILTIFDEVMTGFRTSWGGMQNILKIDADITTLGKVIGGGLPLAAVGGKEEIMNQLAPVGNVYQAGTLSGNPLATTAGLKTLEILSQNKSYYEDLQALSSYFLKNFNELAKTFKMPFQYDFQGGMFGFFFSDNPIYSYEDAKKTDPIFFRNFFCKLLQKNVYLAPSIFEAGFISIAHTQEDIDTSLNSIEDALITLNKN